MCGSTKAPPVVKDDPVADAKKAEAKATAKSNADLAERRRRRARNSLLTLGSQGTDTRVDTADNLLASIDRGNAAAPRRAQGLDMDFGQAMWLAYGNSGTPPWKKQQDTLGDSHG